MRRFRRTKYGNKKTESHGRLFDSKLEAAKYDELLLLEKSGIIGEVFCQVRVPLKVNDKLICTWIVDFQYFDIEKNRNVWLEVKGFMTAVASIKIKLARALYPDMLIEIWKGNKKR